MPIVARALTLTRRLYHVARERGDAVRCDVCHHPARRFLAWGECVNCGARDRHRALWRYLLPRLSRPHRVLHIAPEPDLAKRLRDLSDYVSCDLSSPWADHRVDLTGDVSALGTFDWVLCSHVLEHIPDDRAAMRNLRALTRGACIVQVPERGEVTDENPHVVSPAERLARFGQEDHVRLYGADIRERLAGAGFAVEVLGEGNDRLYVCRSH